MSGKHIRVKQGGKLTSSEAWAIMMAPSHTKDPRFTTKRIAAAYNISTTTVTDIRTGRTWKCLRTQRKPFAADAEAMWLEIEVANAAGCVKYVRETSQ